MSSRRGGNRPCPTETGPLVPLTARDRTRLEAYLLTENPPLADLARAMLALGCKMEQEAFLVEKQGPS